MIELKDIQAAAKNIKGVAVRTPLIKLPLEDEVYAKPENLQKTNSFKFRGAYNFLSNLSAEERAKGLVADSSGNHAQGVACAAHLFGADAKIVIPENAPPIKVERTKAWGASVVRSPNASEDREAAAAVIVESEGRLLVPPFNHPWIMAGQGTAGLEIAEDLDNNVANIIICLGGGGLLSGISTAIRALAPQAQILGVEPAFAADGKASFESGEVQKWSAEQVTRTIADGARTQQLGDLTFEVIKARVDGIVAVSEEGITNAMRWFLQEAKLVVEPTGAMALAAYFAIKNNETEFQLKEGPTVVIISGGNIDPQVLSEAALS